MVLPALSNELLVKIARPATPVESRYPGFRVRDTPHLPPPQPESVAMEAVVPGKRASRTSAAS